jgi:hypothetical protein
MKGWLLALAVVAGCAMKVNGFVCDARTGHPIGGARVRIDERSVYTNEVGAYLLKVHRDSSARADVSAPGYDTSSVTCDTPDKHPICDVPLIPTRRDKVKP